MYAKVVSTEEAMRKTGGNALWLTTTHEGRRALCDMMLRDLRAKGKKTLHVWAVHSRCSTVGGTVPIGMPGDVSKRERRALLMKDTGQDRGSPPVLQSCLRVAVGARVVLTKNDTDHAELGLVNGALGTLVALEYDEGAVSPRPGMIFEEVVNQGASPLPVALVRLDKFKSDRTCEHAEPKVVPIFPISTNLKVGGRKFRREQLPLRLARARTIRSAQGMTCDEVVFAPTPRPPNKPPFEFALAYVALSRGRTLAGIWLLNHALEEWHFTCKKTCCSFIGEEYARLRLLQPDIQKHRPIIKRIEW
jgi:hypothetical protein